MDQLPIKKSIPPHIEEHFLAQKKSGLTIKAYCAEMSLSSGTFYGWRTEYLNKPIKQKPPSFKEINFYTDRSPVCDIRFGTGVAKEMGVTSEANNLTSEDSPDYGRILVLCVGRTGR